MTTFDFKDGNGPVPAKKHSYGGGWVADTATVAETAFVGPNARVYDKARVFDDAQVFGGVEDDDTSEDIFIEMNGKRYKLVEVA
jgi:hypothetical protein